MSHLFEKWNARSRNNIKHHMQRHNIKSNMSQPGEERTIKTVSVFHKKLNYYRKHSSDPTFSQPCEKKNHYKKTGNTHTLIVVTPLSTWSLVHCYSTAEWKVSKSVRAEEPDMCLFIIMSWHFKCFKKNFNEFHTHHRKPKTLKNTCHTE